MHTLVVEGMSAGYGGNPVVSDVNFRLPVGSICGIIGPNGSGKSTILKGILDLGVEERCSHPFFHRITTLTPA